MANPITALRQHSRKALLLAALTLVPWVWAVAFIPFWVSAAAAVVVVTVVLIGTSLFVQPAPAQADKATPSAGEGGEKQVARKQSRPLRRLLARWAGLTHSSSNELSETQEALKEVIEQSESAVLEISKSFRNITSRSSQQMNYAMGLLQTTRGPGDVGSGDNTGDDMSLPEYIRAYEVLLNVGLDRLNDFARDCLQLVEQAGEQGGASEASTKLAQQVRRMAEETQIDAEQLRADAVHLSGGMVTKNQEVTDVLKHINNTAQEIRRDVNQLVMAMQFQDITQQRLERVRGPLLSEIIKSLNSIADETRVLSRQLKSGAIPLPDGKSSELKADLDDVAGSKVGEEDMPEEALPVVRDPAAKQSKGNRGAEDSSVELF
jgi:methyl-accepting chemotaxis protein